MSSKEIGLDFETYSPVDLFLHGADRYFSDPDYRVLIGSIFEEGSSIKLDFILNPKESLSALEDSLERAEIIYCHNAGFEKKVLRGMGIEPDLLKGSFLDTAVMSRAAGGSSSLDSAVKQFLPGEKKLESGLGLIKLFSIPSKEREETGFRFFDEDLPRQHQDLWADFHMYCEMDARLTFKLGEQLSDSVSLPEERYEAATARMNEAGWPVDLDLVTVMQERYFQNLDAAEQRFRELAQEPKLNLNSSAQLKEWCLARGVKSNSFDTANVEKLLKAMNKRLSSSTSMTEEQKTQYEQVQLMLETKQILGGSSLKKLQTILDTVGEDGRLREQYVHIGAGQTFRTSGRGVQMQNLKRLNGADEIHDLTEVEDQDNDWLGANLRQVFTSSHPEGKLIVGDLASIESRGLAWSAREQWKLDAYAEGKDVYKVLAQQIYDIDYDSVLKPQRNIGKVGELSCGYGAGGEAVHSFAQGMGVDMSVSDASTLVVDWRATNPKTVEYWNGLDSALHGSLTLAGARRSVPLSDGYFWIFTSTAAPSSLRKAANNPDLLSLEITLHQVGGLPLAKRVFHGIYRRGRSICYWKPSSRKTGEPWSDTFVHPKTKRRTYYSIYGGKLAGILTQSLCREIFFAILGEVETQFAEATNVKVIGQFHDELVLDWTPVKNLHDVSLSYAETLLKNQMSQLPQRFINMLSLPMDAEVSSAYRYIK